MQLEEKRALVTDLSQFVTEARWRRMQSVSQQRTRHISIVLEDIYQPHNASAVLRSCDCLGVQDIYLIENRNTFSPNKGVSLGAERWLTLYHYNKTDANNTEWCLEQLRGRGYKIVATTPHEKALTIAQLPLDNKLALVFGAESSGLSQQAQEAADVSVSIPMVGFSESFNISVSVALCLYELVSRLQRSSVNYTLTEEEQLDLQLTWLQNSVRVSEYLVLREDPSSNSG